MNDDYIDSDEKEESDKVESRIIPPTTSMGSSVSGNSESESQAGKSGSCAESYGSDEEEEEEINDIFASPAPN